jgi:hypothetical protein
MEVKVELRLLEVKMALAPVQELWELGVGYIQPVGVEAEADISAVQEVYKIQGVVTAVVVVDQVIQRLGLRM